MMNIGAHRVPICIVLQDFYKWGPAIGFPFVLMVSLLVRGTINADFYLFTIYVPHFMTHFLLHTNYA